MIFGQNYCRKQIASLLTLLVLMGTHDQTFAVQDNGFSGLPVSAKNIQDFIPQGWYLENKIDAQLDNDNFTDTILVLTDRNKTVKSSAEGNRKLVILFGKVKGEFEMISVAHHLLWCEECYGTLGGPDGNFPEIKVSKGVLSIYQSGGSNEAIDVTLKFRYEAKSNKFRLIGKDTIVRDRASGNFETDSVNYLTSQKKVGNVTFDRFGMKSTTTDKVEKIKPAIIYLETYNIDDL